MREALETGRSAGVRLWMFIQFLAQLQPSYGRDLAEGMVASCGVRVFMNPAQEDGTAQKVCDMLGYRERILDGKRHRLVEPADLTTKPEWRDMQIVFGDNTPPAKVLKAFAHRIPEISTRMGKYEANPVSG